MRTQEVFNNIGLHSNDTVTSYQRGTNSNIITVLHKNIALSIEQTKPIAKYFKGDTVRQTCENIWKFLREEINYEEDGSHQKVSVPNRFLFDKKGDCKSYSLFTIGILSNLDIKWKFRYASYDPDNKTPQHVYVVTDTFPPIIIDGVWNKFNSEKPYTFVKDYKMKISTITGTNNVMIGNSDVMIGGFFSDAWNKVKDTVNDVADSIGDFGKATLLALPRNAYLALLKINFRGWATSLNNGLHSDQRDSMHKTWTRKAGGKFTALESAAKKGSARRRILGVDDIIITGIYCKRQNRGIGIEPVSTGSAALVASAGAVIAIMKDVLKAAKQAKDVVQTADSTAKKYGIDISDIIDVTKTGSGKGSSTTGTSGKKYLIFDSKGNPVIPTFTRGESTLISAEDLKDVKVDVTDLFSKLRPTTGKDEISADGSNNGLLLFGAIVGGYLLLKKR